MTDGILAKARTGEPMTLKEWRAYSRYLRRECSDRVLRERLACAAVAHEAGERALETGLLSKARQSWEIAALIANREEPPIG